MSRRVVAHGERQAAWRLTQVLLLGAFALGAHGAWDLFASGDETSGATTTTTAPVDDGEPDGGSSTTPSTTSTPATSTLEPARSFTLVATGDLLIHEFVADRAADYGGDGTWDFGPMFRRVRPILAGADVALCHLETPLSSDNSDLAYYPGFRVPFELADAIAEAGYDGCSLASNHSLDAGRAGVRSTLDHLRRAGVATTGMADVADDDHDYRCRDLCPAVGTDEAAATGTTNRALACWLVRQDLLGLGVDGYHVLVAGQGIEMGQPSVVCSEVEGASGEVARVRVGGVATRIGP